MTLNWKWKNQCVYESRKFSKDTVNMPPHALSYSTLSLPYTYWLTTRKVEYIHMYHNVHVYYTSKHLI